MIRALLVGDTHVGFDLPARPRVERRRRGHDFQANYERAVADAVAARVDLVLHAGDVFHRPNPRPALVADAFGPLHAAAEAGCEVVVLPGNHERSVLPATLVTAHPRIHVVDRPRTVLLKLQGARVAVGAFPYARRIRARFRGLVRDTGLAACRADVRLLLFHHCVEGSTVEGHVFRDAPDVVRGRDLPADVAAVLSGHIHRHQVLGGWAAPVLYAGSVERTAFAERDDPKGCLELGFAPGPAGGQLVGWRFHPLPARPMRRVSLRGRSADALLLDAERAIRAAPPDAVLRLRCDAPDEALAPLTAARLRAMAPATMNVDLRPPRRR